MQLQFNKFTNWETTFKHIRFQYFEFIKTQVMNRNNFIASQPIRMVKQVTNLNIRHAQSGWQFYQFTDPDYRVARRARLHTID